MHVRWPTAFVGVLLLGAAACRPTDKCAESGVPCGGDPTGRWKLVDQCQDPTVPSNAISQRTYLGQPINGAQQPPPEPTSSDWCADLKYGPDGIAFLNLPYNARGLIGAYINYAGDHTYGAFVTTSDTTTLDLSASCLSRFGFASTCADFAKAFATFGASLGGVKDTSCKDDGNGGCLCAYTIEGDAAGSSLTGKWGANGSVLTHFAGSMVLPSQADYCVAGDSMTLWGHDRTNLFDLPGVRTINLQRIVCGNGVVERGETCEPPNTATCDANCQTVTTP
jgi:hypothetical protein